MDKGKLVITGKDTFKKVILRTTAFAAIGFATLISLPHEARADCTVPAAVEGALDYYYASQIYRFCDGTSWVSWASGGSITLPIDVEGEEDILNFGGGTPTATFMRQIKADRSIAFGEDAGAALLDANDALDNTFIGYNAGAAVTTGDENTLIGADAGSALNTGSFNTFLGQDAGEKTTTGDNNIFVGWRAGYSNLGGGYNQFSGITAGRNNTSGSRNIFIGLQAGQNNTTENNNLFIGYQIENQQRYFYYHYC